MTSTESLPIFLTVANVADLYSISRPTIFRLLRAGALPRVKIGRATRIRRADAEAWAASLAGKEAPNA